MTQLSYPIPVPGSDLNSFADPEIATALQAILTWANGQIDLTNLSAALQALIRSWSSGTFAARPVAGTAGRFYYATDTHQLFLDNGSVWVSVPSGLSGASTIGGALTVTGAATLTGAASMPGGISGEVDIGTMRATTQTLPSSGSGLEVWFGSGTGVLSSRNAVTTGALPLQISGNPVTVTPTGAVGSPTIIDFNGNSSFVTRAGRANGTSALNGGSTSVGAGATVNAPHGLGRTPASVVVGQSDGAAGSSLSWTYDGTNVSITNHDLGNAHTAQWLAFG